METIYFPDRHCLIVFFIDKSRPRCRAFSLKTKTLRKYEDLSRKLQVDCSITYTPRTESENGYSEPPHNALFIRIPQLATRTQWIAKICSTHVNNTQFIS